MYNDEVNPEGSRPIPPVEITRNFVTVAHSDFGRRVYRRRIAHRELESRLARSGAVLIEGARASGKTVLARMAAASWVMLDADRSARRVADVDPGLLLRGETPRLIDEWQVVPEVWNHVRHAVDERVGRGHFILTGSAVPPDDITRHTGAGRISRLRLRPMSLVELARSTGEVSLARLLARRPAPSVEAKLSVEEIAELICVGGWPGHLGGSEEDPPRSPEDAMEENRDYLGEIRRADIQRVDGNGRDPARVGRFLQSLGRNVATCASLATLARDLNGPDRDLDHHTARSYLTALERLMIVEDQPPWAPHLRSRSRLRAAAKRHFVDPSLAVAALSATPEHLLRDFEWFGLLFESMVVRDLVVRDLRVYAQAAGATVHHYRDNTGLEVDAVVDVRPGECDGLRSRSSLVPGGGRLIRLARALLKFARPSGHGAVRSPCPPGGAGRHRRQRQLRIHEAGLLGVAVIPVGALEVGMGNGTDVQQEFAKDLIWKAMYEADVHRRYYGAMCDRLRRLNTCMVLGAWGVALMASVLAITSVPIAWSVGGIIVAAALTTLRDVLRIPERVSESRYILTGTNREYDKMRLLWDTEGTYRPRIIAGVKGFLRRWKGNHESFRAVSRLHDFTNEVLDQNLLESAQEGSKKYHVELIDREKKELASA